jgi:hypothetical protein
MKIKSFISEIISTHCMPTNRQNFSCRCFAAIWRIFTSHFLEKKNSVMGREKLLLFFLSRFAYLIIGANNRSTVYNLSPIRKKVVEKECSGFEKKDV